MGSPVETSWQVVDTEATLVIIVIAVDEPSPGTKPRPTRGETRTEE